MKGLKGLAGIVLLIACCDWAPDVASAQGADTTQMQGMDMSGGKNSGKEDERGTSMHMHPETFIQEIEHHSSSGPAQSRIRRLHRC